MTVEPNLSLTGRFQVVGAHLSSIHEALRSIREEANRIEIIANNIAFQVNWEENTRQLLPGMMLVYMVGFLPRMLSENFWKEVNSG